MTDTPTRPTDAEVRAYPRTTSADVDNVLMDWQQHPDIVLEICHDLLDAWAEVERLMAENRHLSHALALLPERGEAAQMRDVVGAARAVEAAFDNDEFDTSNIVVETVLLRLFNTLDTVRSTASPSQKATS